MFAQGDGPTALRADLIRALAFSLQDVEVDMGRGPERARAGLAGVWNGRKGQVVILVRYIPVILMETVTTIWLWLTTGGQVPFRFF